MNKKRIIGLVSAVSVAVGVLSSCGGSKVGDGAEVKLADGGVYPVECEDTLTVWMDLDPRLDGMYSDFGETPLAKELEKRTGIKVKYLHPQMNQTQEQFNVMLASNDLPDIVIYNWPSYGGGADSAIREEYIYSLNDIIKDYAPALSAYLKENPEVDKRIKTDEGNYYSFPFVRGEDWMTCPQGLIMRKDWLDELGLDEPETIDELEEVLRAFKKHGAKAPLVLNTMDNQLKMLMYAYGIDDDFYVDNGKIKYGPATDEFKAALERISSWYREGLLDNNLVSADRQYIQSRMLNSDAGAFFGYVVSGLGALLDAAPNDTFDLVAVRQPTVNGGKPELAYKEDKVLGVVAAAITTNCKNPELAARFLDYGYTEEGHMLYNFGIEGESYEMKDGKPVFTELITNNPNGLTFAQAAVSYSRAPYNGQFVQDPEYVRQSLTYPKQQQHAYDIWADNNMDEHMLPPLTFLPEEQDEYAEIMNNINTYVSEKEIAYVTGKESLDTFDDYLAQLEKYNLSRAIELRQNALDRYNKR